MGASAPEMFARAAARRACRSSRACSVARAFGGGRIVRWPAAIRRVWAWPCAAIRRSIPPAARRPVRAAPGTALRRRRRSPQRIEWRARFERDQCLFKNARQKTGIALDLAAENHPRGDRRHLLGARSVGDGDFATLRGDPFASRSRSARCSAAAGPGRRTRRCRASDRVRECPPVAGRYGQCGSN